MKRLATAFEALGHALLQIAAVARAITQAAEDSRFARWSEEYQYRRASADHVRKIFHVRSTLAESDEGSTIAISDGEDLTT